MGRKNIDLAEWRGSFDERYGSGAFDRMVALFEQNLMSLAKVGAEFGVSRQMAHQWYGSLRDEYGWPADGVRRRSERVAAEKAKKPLLPSVVRQGKVVDCLKSSGIEAGVASNRTIEIDGGLARVYESKTSCQFAVQAVTEYWRFQCWSKVPEELVLFVCGDPMEAVYLIDKATLMEARKPQKRHFMVYIPASFEWGRMADWARAINWGEHLVWHRGQERKRRAG